MAVSGGRQRFSAIIWPGFVDVMTALILVLFFVLSIFMIVQFVLRDTITGQGRRLEELSLQVASLADTLGLERSRADTQAALVTTLTGEREAAQGRIAALTGERDVAAARIADFEAQVASLIARNTDLGGRLAATEAESAERLDAKQALDALVAKLQAEATDAAAARTAAAATEEELRARLEGTDAELTAMTLALEAERKKAEETLTLLAAAEAARRQLAGSSEAALTEAQTRAAELAQANILLAEQKEISAEGQRQVALLNQQTASLRSQLNELQGLLDAAETADASAQVQIESLGQNLNAALARVAVAEKRRAELEAKERERLAAEAKDLERYRSEFFGQMRQILGEREGVQVVGDRFVFPSEVLFAPGSATLGPEGQAQVGRVATVIREIADEIPPDIDWILRVDGHTDRTPVSPTSPFRDNWELSEARALSVVRYMVEREGLPPGRLAATGFGEFQPVDPGDSPEALARNRRIELKFTER